ncbi:ParA family protein [Paenibacillus sp. FSL M7-1455]|uniref:ParA family protein n=1 Tax=Paenibacillus sp. FSL M7-1455 TaxID=2975316 RepID=UPI0030FA813C
MTKKAKVISFGIQKGGSSKTTTSGVVSYLLSQNYRVLAIDMDSQGNLTELLTQRDIYDFHGKTILEALQKRDANGYIYQVTDNLHLIGAEDHLATFSRWLYGNYRGNQALVMSDMLDTVRDKYDYIIIDTPPALGDQTMNALSASDYVVAMFEASKFCYSALGRFLESCVHVQTQVNPDLKIAGILRGLIDARRTDNKALIDLVQQEYGDLCFKTILIRNAAAGRLSINGLFDNNEMNAATRHYKLFVKELLERVGETVQA